MPPSRSVVPFVEVVLCAVCAICGTGKAATADEPSTIWGLADGNRFVVSVMIVKQTEVTVDGQQPVIAETRDRFEIEYRVTEVLKNGDVVIAAKLRKGTREAVDATTDAAPAPSPPARALDDLRISFQVDSGGLLTSIDVQDKDALLAALSGLDPSASQLMRDSCPDEVIGSWFGRPFWIAAGSPADEPDTVTHPPKIFERQDSLSLGPFGILRTEVELKPVEAADEEALLSISGTGRFVPLVILKSSSVQMPLPLKDFSAELDDYSGKVQLSRDASALGEPPVQSLKLDIRFHGTGTLQNPATSESQSVTFRQSQTQLWILTNSFAIRRAYDVPQPENLR